MLKKNNRNAAMLLQANGSARGRHAWMLNPPHTPDPVVFGGLIRISADSFLVHPEHKTSNMNKQYTRAQCKGQMVFESNEALRRYVNFLGAHLRLDRLFLHHDDGIVTFSRFGNEAMPFTVAPTDGTVFATRDTFAFPAATEDMQAGDLAYMTYTVDTRYQNKVQFNLRTACKIGRCVTDEYASDCD